MPSRPTHTDPIARATGRPWSEWTSLLDAEGARDLPHKDIVPLARERMPADLPNAGWWAQNVTVAYEQHIGRRQPGQSCDGSFQVSASRTLKGSMDEVLAAWVGLVGERTDFGGVPLDGEARTSETEKWRYWRATLADGTQIAVNISRKNDDKAVLAVQHSKLADADAVSEWRAHWKGLLKEL